MFIISVDFVNGLLYWGEAWREYEGGEGGRGGGCEGSSKLKC